MRKTKIVCTLGPASATEEVLTKMAQAGMDVARFNMSHGTHESHHRLIEVTKKVRKKLGKPIALMIDTNGPEIRVGEFEEFSVRLEVGDRFVFTTNKIHGTHAGVMVNYPHFPKLIKKDDIIFANDGLIKFVVKEVSGNDVFCEVLTGGVLSSKKSLSVPGLKLDTPYLTEDDKSHLLFGIKEGAEVYAISFVSCRQDVLDIRNFLKANGDNGALICSKIENADGVKNIDEIIDVSDSIMVARGDLGVEVPFEKIPYIQKEIISKCLKAGKNVITATEMLESMIESARPTRAEISDVANAVEDGSSCVMLSGETSAGKNPVLCVETMAKIALERENHMQYGEAIDFAGSLDKNASAGYAAAELARSLGAAYIVVHEESFVRPQFIAKFRPNAKIVVLTSDQNDYNKYAIYFDTYPLMVKANRSRKNMIDDLKIAAKKAGAKNGDSIVLVMPSYDTDGSAVVLASSV